MKANVLVLGLARSGLSVANLLKSAGYDVTVSDSKPYPEIETFASKLLKGVKVVAGEHPLSLLDGIDSIVLSPGVAVNIPILTEAKRRGIPVLSEVEIAYQALEKFKDNMPFVDFLHLSVTGTNGKSTTTTLLYELIKANGFNVILAGNIGTPLSEVVHRFIETESIHDYPDVYFFVTELSSFQLETIQSFKPYGSTILNITPDHLDRYKDMSEYVEAKCRIFKNQTVEGFVVLNADDPYTKDIEGKIASMENPPKVFYFSRKKKTNGAYFRDRRIHINIPDKKIERLLFKVDNLSKKMTLNPEGFKLRGVHNIENIMAAVLMAVLSGCRKDPIETTLECFEGLEHRLEFVRELEGVTYINDSKGTNIGAVAKSLEGFNTPVILIAGGRDKSSDFKLLRPYVKGRVKALILIGEAADKIAKALRGCCEIYRAEDLRYAVLLAKDIAVRGDTVLLSPACASFDMFRDFEDRGRQFKEIVRGL